MQRLFVLCICLSVSIWSASPAAGQEREHTNAEMEGRGRGTRGIVPTDKISIAAPVESPVDFGQLKAGARVPALPPLFDERNIRMDPTGECFDLNKALLERPTLLVFWRG